MVTPRPNQYRYVLEVTLVIDDAGSEQTFYFADKAWVTRSTDTPANTHMEGRLISKGKYRAELFSEGRISGGVRPSWSVLLLHNADGALDAWEDYGVSGGRCVLRRGTLDAAYPADYETAWIAYLHTAFPVSEETMQIEVRDRSQLFEQPVVTDGFLATGGLEGNGSVSKRKQWVSNDPGFIEPILIDATRHIYFVQSTSTAGLHEAGLDNPIGSSYPFECVDGGTRLARGANYSNAAELLADSVGAADTVRFWFGPDAAVPGWKNGPVYMRADAAPDFGYRVFALGGPTDADHARRGATLGSFFASHLALRAGLTAADLAADSVDTSINSLLIDDDTSINQALRHSSELLGQYYGMTRLDQFRTGYLLDPESDDPLYGTEFASPTPRPSTSVATFTKHKTDNFRRVPIDGMRVPIKQITVQAGAVWPCPLDPAAPAVYKDYLSREEYWFTAGGYSASTALANPAADSITVSTPVRAIQNSLGVSVTMSRLFMLYGGRRRQFAHDAGLTSANMAIELGQAITLKRQRFGLDAGVKFRVIAYEHDHDLQICTLWAWGGQPGAYTGDNEDADDPALFDPLAIQSETSLPLLTETGLYLLIESDIDYLLSEIDAPLLTQLGEPLELEA